MKPPQDERRAASPVPGGPGSTPQPCAQTYPGYEALLTTVAATGQEPDAAEVESLRDFGERAAADGTTLRSLVVRHLAAARAAWPGGATGAGGVLAAVQLAVEALCEGYERAQQLAVREQEAARRSSSTTCCTGAANRGSWPNARNSSGCGSPTLMPWLSPKVRSLHRGGPGAPPCGASGHRSFR